MAEEFTSVKDNFIRAVLRGGQRDDDVTTAVGRTEVSLSCDYEDETVSHAQYRAREKAYNEAKSAWTAQDYPTTVAALRRFWTD